MAKVLKVTLSEFFPFQAGLTKGEALMEGGPTDRRGRPHCTLEDYMEGKAPYVSLACDPAGGAPGNAKEFRVYGYRVWLPELSANINSFLDKAVTVPVMIDFRLVDTGDHFRGKTKRVRVAGREPIDVCRRGRPAKGKSFSIMSTELRLMGPP